VTNSRQLTEEILNILGSQQTLINSAVENVGTKDITESSIG
jgi:hypothetical protein